MTNRKLEKRVLAGLLGLTLGTCSPFAIQPSVTEAASASLYSQYQETAREDSIARNAVVNQDTEHMTRAEKEKLLHDLQEQVREAQAAVNHDTDASSTKAKDSTSKDSGKDASSKQVFKDSKDGTSADSPTDFLTRVRKILDSYGKTDTTTTTQTPAAQKPATSNTAPAQAKTDEQTKQSNPDLFVKKFTYYWRGTPLQQTLYTVAKIAGKGIIINGSLQGNVYGSLHQASCEQVLDYLSRAYNFNWQIDGNNIIIGTDSIMMQSAVLPVNYRSKDKVVDELKALGLTSAYANSETGTVSITGTPYQILEAKKRLATIDHPVAQCLLVAQLIEIDHGKDKDLGFQYSLPTYSHSADDSATNETSKFRGPWLDKLTFSAVSSANKALSKGKVIARPMVMSLNGEEGMVKFGDQVPILSQTSTSTSTNVTVEYKDVGTTLTVTPTINETTGEITLKVATEVSNIVSWMSSGQTKAPQIATRQATTSAHLHSGQSFVIGGLMSSKDLDNLSGIPGLMQLPILGELFKYHSRSRSYAEVYVMLTPYIVTDNIDTRQLLREAESVKMYTGGEDYYGSNQFTKPEQ